MGKKYEEHFHLFEGKDPEDLERAFRRIVGSMLTRSEKFVTSSLNGVMLTREDISFIRETRRWYEYARKLALENSKSEEDDLSQYITPFGTKPMK